jgi:hypothetical protein
VVADSGGDVVGPDDVTAPSDIGGESRGSAGEVNGDEFASGQQKAMVTPAISVTWLCIAVIAHNVAMRVDPPLTRIWVSLEGTGKVNRRELAMVTQ